MKCSICLTGELKSFGFVQFDRNNQDIPEISNTLIEYYKCEKCGSITSPEMLNWPTEKFSSEIYNEEYFRYDPDYLGERPKIWANMLSSLNYKKIKHLDYGSGSGLLSKNLKLSGWNTCSYDPYSSKTKPEGKFNFITAIEVFEHSTNIRNTILDIKKYLDRDGIILFSSVLVDSSINSDWWYIMPRNGHISFLSKLAIINLAKEYSLFFSSFNKGIHLLQTNRSVAKQLGIE